MAWILLRSFWYHSVWSIPPSCFNSLGDTVLESFRMIPLFWVIIFDLKANTSLEVFTTGFNSIKTTDGVSFGAETAESCFCSK